MLAATNRPDVLDQALLRPGRFDRRVTVQPPDKVGREAILKVHTRGVPLAPDVDLKIIAVRRRRAWSAPTCATWSTRPRCWPRAATRTQVHQKDFLDALEKLVLGPARHLVMSPAERERVAYHEGGHTILGLLVPGADPVNRVTIMPRGQALGVTYQRPEDDRHNYGEEYLRARIIGAMGGRAAEEVVYGSRTTGAENDMQQATDLARQMVTRWGMSESAGAGDAGPARRPFLAAATRSAASAARNRTARRPPQSIDAEVSASCRSATRQACTCCASTATQLDRLAEALLEHETLDEQEILRVTQLKPAPRSNEMPLAAMPAAAFTPLN